MNLTKILILSKIENNNNFDIFSNHKMEEIVLLFELDKYKFLFIYRLWLRGDCAGTVYKVQGWKERDILI